MERSPKSDRRQRFDAKAHYGRSLLRSAMQRCGSPRYRVRTKQRSARKVAAQRDVGTLAKRWWGPWSEVPFEYWDLGPQYFGFSRYDHDGWDIDLINGIPVLPDPFDEEIYDRVADEWAEHGEIYTWKWQTFLP